MFHKFIFGVVLVSALISSPSYAQNFISICRGNGEPFKNVVIHDFIVMGSEFNRKLYISFDDANGNHHDAQKSYNNTNEPSDRFLISTARLVYLTGKTVDICVTGNSHEIYGISL